MKKRVLILEDEPHVRLLMERVLARAGWDVVAVEDLASALEHVESADLMIVDYYLAKDERGPDLIRRAHEQLGLETPPALLVTGTPDEVPDEDCELFIELLAKPFKVDQLVVVANRIVRKHSAPPSSRTQLKAMHRDEKKRKDEAV